MSLFEKGYNEIPVSDYDTNNYVTVDVMITRDDLEDLIYTAAELYINQHTLVVLFNSEEDIPDLEHCADNPESVYEYVCKVTDLFRLLGNDFVDKVIEAKHAKTLEFLSKARVVEIKSARNV